MFYPQRFSTKARESSPSQPSRPVNFPLGPELYFLFVNLSFCAKIDQYLPIWPHRLVVRTRRSQRRNRGSTPLEAANKVSRHEVRQLLVLLRDLKITAMFQEQMVSETVRFRQIHKFLRNIHVNGVAVHNPQNQKHRWLPCQYRHILYHCFPERGWRECHALRFYIPKELP